VPRHGRRHPFTRTTLTEVQRRQVYDWLRALGKTASEARQLRDQSSTIRQYRQYKSGPVTKA
jgi:hypothetical protein